MHKRRAGAGGQRGAPDPAGRLPVVAVAGFDDVGEAAGLFAQLGVRLSGSSAMLEKQGGKVGAAGAGAVKMHGEVEQAPLMIREDAVVRVG